MSPELAAPAALVLLAVVVLVHTQWLGPRRTRRRLSARLAEQGWTVVAAEDEPDWHEVMTLAIEENQGASRTWEFDQSSGPVTFHVKRAEKRSGRPLDVYRDPGAARPRYAATGVREKRVDSRSFLHRDRHTSVGREIWIGEARRIPVERPEMVFSGLAQIIGRRGRELARGHGLDPEMVPELASPPGDALARALREALLSDVRAQGLMARVFLGPRSWVLVVPFARAGRRIDDILDLACEIAAVIDRHAGWERTGRV